MEKVKLPRDVAEELTAMKVFESYPIRLVVDIFHGIVSGESGALKLYFETDRSRRIELVMNALVNDFEVEETPLTINITSKQIETFRRDYETIKRLSKNDIRFDWKLQGMEKTIELFNIKIEGIN